MKNFKLFACCTIIIFTILLIVSSCVYASTNIVSSNLSNTVSDLSTNSTIKSNALNNYIIPSDIAPKSFTEEINSNSTVFAFKSNQILNTDVNGDVFICANTTEINSTINGNVFVCSETVRIGEKANIRGSLFICAQYVNIDGGTVDNIYDFSKSFTLGSKATITKDVFIGGENISINGIIERNAFIGCKKLDINALTAKIGNNLNYSAESPVTDIDKVVTGEIKFNDTSEQEDSVKSVTSLFKPFALILHIIISLVSAILITLIVLFFCDNFSNKSVKLIKNKPLITFLYGFVGIITVIAISIMAIVSIIGSTFGFLLGLLAAFAFLISSTITTITISKLISDKLNKGKGTTIIFVMLLTIAYSIIGYIPILGGIIKYIYFVYGFGIMLYCFIHKVIPEKNTQVK